MLYINKITSEPQQKLILTGIQGVTINMKLRFMPRIQRWTMDIETATNQIYGIAVTTSPNMLRQYRNQIPFGIACIANAGVDPFTVNDFAAQTANLYLLDSDDVETIETDFF